ncbi:hypothetical protein A3E49_00145 [Candidatus Saccharibacteria bacterium RIFCSPHIGHO2_12_FULL_49_19]|nr:MAG: hypothetical protein A2708_02500 [Candidatus Saccharibacteria bacterium RIFCSPHIGHO2_01_FULL_49_21]OGL37228.1 MAG: hypothetical protein A3E49_00145 [Candidatus Saccharibacteria bacterium RIFCSPHIGHO2_12_FULL_49_19]OGL37821.1 MAG: hypothetical protein A3B63_00025 [Candidatus Saccharibacteria bacterium RIFCSPLOWO2_01_FULL_49_22]
MSETTLARPEQTKVEVPNYSKEWVTYVPDKKYGVTIDLESRGRAVGTLTYDEEGRASMYVDGYEVSEGYEMGQGIGKDLLRALAAEAKEFEAVTISGHFVNQASLGAFASIFGAEKLRFFTRYGHQPVSISFDEAIKYPDQYIAEADLGVISLEKTDPGAESVDDSNAPPEPGVFQSAKAGQWVYRKFHKGETGHQPAMAALELNMINPNPNLRRVTLNKYLEMSQRTGWVEAENHAIPLDLNDPNKAQRKYNQELIAWLREQYGDEMFGEDGEMKMDDSVYMVRPYQLPEWTERQTNDPENWAAVSGGRVDLTPPVLQAAYPEYISPDDPDPAKQDKRHRIIEDYGLSDERWQAKQGKRLSDGDRITYAISESYITPGNIGSQAKGLLQEVYRSGDPKTSQKLAEMLAFMASGGRAAADRLVLIAGGEGSSLMEIWNQALSYVTKPDGSPIYFQDYVNAARENKPQSVPHAVLPAA